MCPAGWRCMHAVFRYRVALTYTQRLRRTDGELAHGHHVGQPGWLSNAVATTSRRLRSAVRGRKSSASCHSCFQGKCKRDPSAVDPSTNRCRSFGARNQPSVSRYRCDLSFKIGSPLIVYLQTVTNDMLALIWAYCDMNPQSPDSATVLNQHLDSGAFVMDVSQDLASSTSPSSSSGSTLMPVKQLPMAAPQARSPLDELRIYASMIRTHAILFGIAFLILLPLGALVARLSRTWNPFWFVSHWIIQFYLGAPLSYGTCKG